METPSRPKLSPVRRFIEAPVYTLGIELYRAAVAVAALGGGKARLLHRGLGQTEHILAEKVSPSDKNIWVHAASLGEFEQGRPLMEYLRRTHPEYKIILTFFSPSGYEVRKNWPGADAVMYLPFDTPGRVRRFLNAVNPQMAIFVKYEIWRNYLSALSSRGIPAYLISAAFRPGQKFFKSRLKWYGEWLRWFSTIFVQDSGSIRLLESIGIHSGIVAGDTRFDRVTDVMRSNVSIPEIERFVGAHDRRVAIYGSSWEADEEVYFPWLKSRRGEVKAIIAPHEFNAARLDKMCRMLEPLKAVLMTQARANPSLLDRADVLIMDLFGLLSSAYRYADVAYIGGGFGAGIHNINEAAVYAMPVVFGPNYSRFIEAEEIIAAAGGFSVASREQYEQLMTATLGDISSIRTAGLHAGAYIESKLGATKRIVETLGL